MHIDARTYLDAATEHCEVAKSLYAQGQYVCAIYLAGVSVECILRAYLDTTSFDSRHDLNALLRESDFLKNLPDRHVPGVGAALTDVWRRWRNTHRYFSAARFRRYLVEHGLYKGIKGDLVKENTRLALSGAVMIVSHGAKRWTPS